MSYRSKKNSESWNQYLINIFRECSGTNFCEFLDRFFKYGDRLQEYQAGIQKEKEDFLERNTKKDSSVDNTSGKVSFAKKPDRLKQGKGFLF